MTNCRFFKSLLEERTAVVAIDTNADGYSSADSQVASTSTNEAADSTASGAAGSNSSESGSSQSTTGSAAVSTNDNADSEIGDNSSQNAAGGAASGEQGEGASSQASASSQYIDYQVQDQNGKMIGTVEAIWDDQQGTPRFLAVKTEGKKELCIIPSSEVQQSQNREVLRVPYSAEILNQAPTLASEKDLDAQQQQRIMAFYEQQEAQTSNAGQPSSAQSAGAQSQSQVADAERVDDATIRLKEEQLKIGKRRVEAGGVLLRKVVRTETTNKPVQLRREELVIERVPGSGEPVEGNAEFAEREVFIPLFREEPVVQKDVVVKEVINVGKMETQEQDTINAKLREEELRVIRQGDARTASGAPASTESDSSAQSSGESQQQPNSQQGGQQAPSQGQPQSGNQPGDQ